MITRLQLRPEVAECLFYNSIAITDVARPFEFFKNKALRLGWIEMPHEDCDAVLFKELPGTDDNIKPSIFLFNEPWDDSPMSLMFRDAGQTGFFVYFDHNPEDYLCENTFVSRIQFHQRIEQLLANVSVPGPFPAELGGRPNDPE